MKKSIIALAGAILFTTLGCVIRTEHTITAEITLNIRQIEEQAEDILNFIEGESDELPGLGGDDNTSKRDPASWQNLLRALSPMQTAYAAEIKNSSSPLIKEIAGKLRGRNDKIVALKKKGCIGETNRGYVELRKCAEQEDAEKKNAAQKVLADENKDRKALYRDIARINKDGELTVTQVENIYAQSRLKRGKKGEQFQLPAAGPEFDAIKKSTLGQKLGSKAKAAAWLTIP
jgi:uncharacterized protein YdbL (DUF1318 family)